MIQVKRSKRRWRSPRASHLSLRSSRRITAAHAPKAMLVPEGFTRPQHLAASDSVMPQPTRTCRQLAPSHRLPRFQGRCRQQRPPRAMFLRLTGSMKYMCQVNGWSGRRSRLRVHQNRPRAAGQQAMTLQKPLDTQLCSHHQGTQLGPLFSLQPYSPQQLAMVPRGSTTHLSIGWLTAASQHG